MPVPSDTWAVYFSHSWRPRDTDLNLKVWQQISESCELLVDVPEVSGPNPPYYINRIEELLRQSNLFICVLTHRSERVGKGEGDAGLYCSPYSLFEIRLAEHFDIPRLVLYERETRFRTPLWLHGDEKYIPFDRGNEGTVPPDRFWRSASQYIDEWLKRARRHHIPQIVGVSSLAVTLIPPNLSNANQVSNELEVALSDAGYEQVVRIETGGSTTELYQLLRAAGLVVMELSSNDSVFTQINTVAHTLCVPAIRMLRAGSQLPWLLEGPPGGYQEDIVTWENPADIKPLVYPRAKAMFRISRDMTGRQADRYFESKRYSQAFIFISHTLKPPDRTLVERIFELLEERYVTPFEYHLVNDPGVEWKDQLNEQLNKTTHFIALLTDGYEVSEVCTYEMDRILERNSEVQIIPFMAIGRSKPHPKLASLHHYLLKDKDVDANANEVVEKVMEVLAKG